MNLILLLNLLIFIVISQVIAVEVSKTTKKTVKVTKTINQSVPPPPSFFRPKPNSGQLSNEVDYVGKSERKPFSLKVLWEIENFSFRAVHGSNFWSPVFRAKDTRKSGWMVKIVPTITDSKATLQIFLMLKEIIGEEPILVKGSVSIVSKNHTKLYENNKITRKFPALPLKKGFGFDLADSVNLVNILDLIHPEDTLRVFTRIHFMDKPESHSEEPIADLKLKKDSNCQAMQSLISKLAQDDEYHDVAFWLKETMICGGHKAILAPKSPKMKKFFDEFNPQTHKIASNGRLNINLTNPDLTPGGFKDMIYWMYTGDASNTSTNYKDIFIAAQYFQVEELQDIAEDSAGEHTDIQNSPEMIKFAEKYRAKKLKKKISELVRIKASELTPEQWEDMLAKLSERDCDIDDETVQSQDYFDEPAGSVSKNQNLPTGQKPNRNGIEREDENGHNGLHQNHDVEILQTTTVRPEDNDIEVDRFKHKFEQVAQTGID